MQLDLRFQPHHVVGQHRDLGPQQLTVGLLGPRPLGASARRRRLPRHTKYPTTPAPPTSTAGSTQRRCHRRHHCRRRTHPIRSPSRRPPRHRRAQRSRRAPQPCRHPWRRAPPRPARRLGRPAARCCPPGSCRRRRRRYVPGRSTAVGHLAGHLGRVAAGGIGSRRRQHGDVDRRVGTPDRRPQLVDLGVVERPLGLRVDVHRIRRSAVATSSRSTGVVDALAGAPPSETTNAVTATARIRLISSPYPRIADAAPADQATVRPSSPVPRSAQLEPPGRRPPAPALPAALTVRTRHHMRVRRQSARREGRG